ncbi:transposase [Mycobacterium interjectum]|uniref:transposase n=1 Tax=Mycobacterium interjectum TaxID=33895 RepID=UPI00135A38A1|nr:transposase [Mycobacterium interjectum]
MTPTDAGPMLGVSGSCARQWFRDRGGVNPQLTDPVGRLRPRLSIAEREIIMVGVAAKKSIRAIAMELGRHPSTVMREIAINGGGRGSTGRYRRLHRFGANRGGWDAVVSYQAHIAQARSQARARRPKMGKIGRCEPLRAVVEQRLNDKHSPRQIAGVLARTFPDDPEMRVHTPGDLARTKALMTLTARLDAVQVGAHVRHVIVEMISELAEVNQRIHDLDAMIKELVSPLAPNLLAITGISHNSAAVLLAEIGDITRFSSSAKLARYTGCAPIPVYSSDEERHRLHRGGNRRLNSVLYTAAIVQKRFSPAAQHLIARQEPVKGARGARRILKRHLVDVIYRAMHTDQASWQHQITRYQPLALT